MSSNKLIYQSPARSMTSVTSSEASETTSINEELHNNRNTKQPKKAKEIEKERPPWRGAIATTSSSAKAERNALIKAKLLEVSRRAIRAQRLCTVSTQTDRPRTKIMKEVEIDSQRDLMADKCDATAETNEQLYIQDKKQFIFTQTVGVMTECMLLKNHGTQTALPKTNLSIECNTMQDPDDCPPLHPSKNIKEPNNLTNKEKEILSQIEKLKHFPSNDTVNHINEIENGVKSECNLNNDINVNEQSNISTNNYLNEPTMTSWDDFEDEPSQEKFSSESLETSQNTPTRNDKDLTIYKRFLNMKLSPLKRDTFMYNLKSKNWDDSQNDAVNELIIESTKLVNIFDQLSMILGPNLNIDMARNSKKISQIKPSKYQTLLTNACNKLQASIENYKF